MKKNKQLRSLLKQRMKRAANLNQKIRIKKRKANHKIAKADSNNKFKYFINFLFKPYG
ncbi:MAG: hypothetical protein BAJALOKI2v1_290002 [Promethearchaeota archaeon]|nr:MAG: hypothetical protein BAJALOKI2v1_290002 [Candidatus Lokiarchaeota archaeon]